MSNTILIILVLIGAIGSVVFIAYILDRRSKKVKSTGSPLRKPGPIGKIFLWIARILVAVMVLSIIGAFAFQSLALAWFTGACILLYIIDGMIYRVLLLTGR